MKRLLVVVLALTAAACTSRFQLRGTEAAYYITEADPNAVPPIPAKHVPKRLFNLDAFAGDDAKKKLLQITMEHRSIETFENFTLGVIEVSDDGNINPSQKDQVLEMVRRQTKPGGVLVVFIHGWHHGPRTCDRDLCCFRRVLDQLHLARVAANPELKDENVVGVYIGWRGESLVLPYLNAFTLPTRKHVAQRIGRTAGKEIMFELDDIWRQNDDLIMVSVGHSLGGAFLYEAMKGQLTGNIFDIEELGTLQDYRIVRARQDREAAANLKPEQRKARRADIGDLVVLVNPAIEAIEWQPFDNDLPDDKFKNASRDELKKARMAYDKQVLYNDHPSTDAEPDGPQMPVLMTVASKADSAVGKLFPAFRFLQFLVTLRWDMFFKTREWRGMGHYNPHTTHALSHPVLKQADYNPSDVTAPDCDCPFKNYAGLISRSGLKLNDLKDFDQYKLNKTPARERRGPWDAYSPYFVISTDKGVISAHSDIFNNVFVGFLVSFINAYDVAQDDKEKEAKRMN
ncbi:MAG: hypothetical protein AABO58_15320 [Acidobacteriota bacterium]